MIIPFKCDTIKLTSPYAVRTFDSRTEMHPGYDLVGIGSRDIVAVAAGEVVRSRIVTDKSNSTWQWGNYVCIKGNDGRYYYYCHMDNRAVKVGQKVNIGDKLGVMGNTGYSKGAHLHFEVREKNGKTTVNPEKILDIPNRTGTYKLSTLETDVNILCKHGVTNSPEYWVQHAADLKYLPDLIHNMAEVLK